jgi:hypothetical protein
MLDAAHPALAATVGSGPPASVHRHDDSVKSEHDVNVT